MRFYKHCGSPVVSHFKVYLYCFLPSTRRRLKGRYIFTHFPSPVILLSLIFWSIIYQSFNLKSTYEFFCIYWRRCATISHFKVYPCSFLPSTRRLLKRKSIFVYFPSPVILLSLYFGNPFINLIIKGKKRFMCLYIHGGIICNYFSL